jgi:uncharacterized protein YjbI with pentapeptide repeats
MKTIVLTIMVLTVAVGLAYGTACAFNQADFQKLKTTGNCAECDLSGVLLIHWKLAGADLSGTDLSGANLTDAWLAGANLSGANLSNAILTGTSLAGANLQGTRLSGANLLFTNMTGAAWTDGSRCERDSSGSCRR